MTSKTQLDFGNDQDYDVDPEIITRVFIAVEYSGCTNFVNAQK